VRTGVRTDVTAAAVAEILKELRKMAEAPLTTDELGLAKDSQVFALPGRFETTTQLVSSFSNVFVYDLGIDYYPRLSTLLSGVTSQAVQAVAGKYLRPEKMTVVAVGDRAKIESQLNELGLGAIELRDADGSLKEQ
jgi:zinc protease